MAYPRWFGVTTRDGVPRWQVLIVDLTKVLITVAILSLFSQSVTSVLLLSVLSQITTGMMLASAVAVTICAIAIFPLRKRVLAFVIVASRFAFLVSAANTLWLAYLAFYVKSPNSATSWQFGHLLQMTNLAGLFLTTAQSVLSLVLSCICLTWVYVRSRNISQAVVRIMSGFVILPAIALSTKLHWPQGTSMHLEWDWSALILLAWSICLMFLGILNAMLVSSPHIVVDVDLVIKVLEVMNILLASFLVMISIGGFKFNVLSSSSSFGCTESKNFECCHLVTGFYGLCLIMAIEEGMASILSLIATLNQSTDCDGTNGEDANHATHERQPSLPPSYEELFNDLIPGSDFPNEDRNIGCCSEGSEVIVSAGASGAVERQEFLPPQ